MTNNRMIDRPPIQVIAPTLLKSVGVKVEDTKTGIKFVFENEIINAMRLELRRKIEPENIWYQVFKDDYCIKSFGVFDHKEEDVRAAAEVYYDNIILHGIKSEVLKSVEI